MLQSMFSGISGLRTHQSRMDVIGNNIANVNTTGFKSSDATFKEAYVTTLRAPAPGSPGMAIGIGTQLSGITRNFKGGTLMSTGQASNMGISGNGFFVVADPGTADGLGSAYFTRAGDFMQDVNGGNTYLITPDGKRVRGLMGDAAATSLTGLDGSTLTDVTLPTGTTSYSIGLDGVVTASVNGATPTAVARIALASFENNAGLQSVGSNLYKTSAAASIRTFDNAGSSGLGQTFAGMIENSNVDLAQEFTNMIITQRGFQANSKTITTSDEMIQDLLSLKR